MSALDRFYEVKQREEDERQKTKQDQEPEKDPEKKKNDREAEQIENKNIDDMGQISLHGNAMKYRIHLLSIIGEIEGHECLPAMTKSTKYEHVLPKLAAIEDDDEIDGVLVLLNTVGGDVEAGLAIAEMIASLSKPVVTLVLGGGHSIGVPLSVSGDVSFIVPTATMLVHPIRMNGTVIGVRHNYEYIEKMQDRIIHFTAGHAEIEEARLRDIMFNTSQLAKDVGTVLVGSEAVSEGLIHRVGGIKDAMHCLYDLIKFQKDSKI